MSVRQSVVMAATREGRVRVGADVPSVRRETGYAFWVVKQPKFVYYCPGVQGLTDRSCVAVTPVDVFLGCNEWWAITGGGRRKNLTISQVFSSIQHI